MLRARRSSKLGMAGPAALCVLGWALGGCGAADSVKAVPPDPPADTDVDSNINLCPSFAFYLVLPKVIRPGEAAIVTALATDPDSDDTSLTYAWSATSGDFTEPAVALTEYTCADEGPQVLSVTTSDPDGCENYLDLDVTCSAP